jgi:hypothetical protein
MLVTVAAFAQTVPAGVTDAQIREAIAQYRKVWDAMSPSQRKMVLDSGGLSPEMQEEKLRQHFIQSGDRGSGTNAAAPAANRRGGARPEGEREVNLDALRAVSTSTEDLTALRDTNVGRIRKVGCPPEVVVRIAELRSKLGKNSTAEEGSAADLATNWYKREPPSFPSENVVRGQLLDWVLNAGGSQKQDGKSDAEKLNEELERLMGVCAEVK